MFTKTISWDWFKSKKEEKENRFEEISSYNDQKDKDYVTIVQEEFEKESKKVVKKTIYSNGIGTVIFKDYDVFSKEIEFEKMQLVKDCISKEEVYSLFNPPKKMEVIENEEEEYKQAMLCFIEYKQEVLDLLGEDFNEKNGNFYYKTISLPIDSLILNSLIEAKKESKEDVFEGLINFFLWLALNPIESARKDALRFVKENDIPMTKNGILITFRKVVTVNETDTAFVNYISEQFFKKKRQKKSPKGYTIWQDIVSKENFCKKNVPDFENSYEILGNLNDLYFELQGKKDIYYTDAHTRKKKIVFGDIYREDEDKIDLDNTKDCSRGLHSGSISFGSFNSFGDTGAICLLNPSKIRSVPVSDANKLRSSELFMVCTSDFTNYEELVNSKELLDFSDVYAKETALELEEALKNKSFETFTCQEETVSLTILDLTTIKNNISKRIINF